MNFLMEQRPDFFIKIKVLTATIRYKITRKKAIV